MSEKAVQIKNICNDMLNHIKAMEKCVDNLPYYWVTEGSELMRDIFGEDKEKIQRIEYRMQNQIENLNRIIMLYEKSEKESVSKAETLPDAIID